ncbi:MAG: dehydrogenase [Marinobacter sp.]|nr:dehydrogenase [Marinobacter sp.]
MKTVISVSLGDSDRDYDFETEFLGQSFRVIRRGANGDTGHALDLLRDAQRTADAIGLGHVQDHDRVGTYLIRRPETDCLLQAVTDVPITTGATLRWILQEWAIRHTQATLGHFFDNARVLCFSGQTHYRLAAVLSEYTENLFFADPFLQFGVPRLLTSLGQLERYTKLTAPTLDVRAASPRSLTWLTDQLYATAQNLLDGSLHRAVSDAHVVIGSHDQLMHYTGHELVNKTLVTSGVSDRQLSRLRDSGVAMVIDYNPRVLPRPVSINVLEAMITAALDRSADQLTQDDYLEIITSLALQPRLLYPDGYRRVNRFAFVIHPLSQQYLTKKPPLDWIARLAPAPVMDLVEKAAAYTPPFVYSRVSGIRSPTGAEVEGWLITVGGTPKQIMAHGPEFTYRQLLAAARLARRLGAQIMGLGAFTKVVGDAGVTVAKRAPLPITTGNSYSASGALWAAHDASRRLGLVAIGPSGKMQGKAMVVGATGAIGSVCSRLLAKAVDTLYLVSPEPAKLLALKESILSETPDATLYLAASTERDLADMDMVVTATSGAGKRVLDIMKVKPGCVITDVARPLDIPAADVAKRPDVLVIESGEIQLPGNVVMKDIGLPPGIAYACLAETIVLALEGRFENYTLGRSIEWEKVRDIYRMGLKHGMQLAAISGVNGVFTDADLAQVRELALAGRAKAESVRPHYQSG